MQATDEKVNTVYKSTNTLFYMSVWMKFTWLGHTYCIYMYMYSMCINEFREKADVDNEKERDSEKTNLVVTQSERWETRLKTQSKPTTLEWAI